MPSFAQRLINWHRQHGRHDLPWQHTRDPYRVWLSEIMLQQTQVATVIPYYERFLARFPTLASLAAAPLAEVMTLWSGLGYYARARHLHRCAQLLVTKHGGQFPCDPVALAALPGIGRSTANAIAVFCFGARAPILDGNVKRVLCRHRGVAGFPGSAAIESRLWEHAAALLPAKRVGTYIQAQMDLGATVCTRSRPRCEACPVAADCIARREGRIADLPAKRPKKTLPSRATTLLVLRHDECILLERRPAAGIWGGLQSLPELPDGEKPPAYCSQRLGLRTLAVSPGPTLTHGFTHFRLQIASLVCDVEPLPQAQESGLQPFDAAGLAQAALPAPVRRLLAQIQRDSALAGRLSRAARALNVIP